VQLAPWLSGDNNGETLTRLAQMYATALINVGAATAMDWGDVTSPFDNIHPRYKQIVGYRLHLAARGISYGEKIQYKGPQATSWGVVQGTTARVDFELDTLGSGLVFVPKTCDDGVPVNQCGWFDIGTEDGKWTNATATINGNSVFITAPVVGKITGVRYAWANFPVATLYNKEGLPALPFCFPNPLRPSIKV